MPPRKPKKDGTIEVPMSEREVEFLRSAIVQWQLNTTTEDGRYQVLSKREINRLEDKLVGVSEAFDRYTRIQKFLSA